MPTLTELLEQLNREIAMPSDRYFIGWAIVLIVAIIVGTPIAYGIVTVVRMLCQKIFKNKRVNEAYQQGVRDGRARCTHKLAKEFLEGENPNR